MTQEQPDTHDVSENSIRGTASNAGSAPGDDATRGPSHDIEQALASILQQRGDAVPPWLRDDSPLSRLACEFFANNWANFCDTLLSKTQLLRVEPEPSPAPAQFLFEIDRPYKCKRGADGPIELEPGPIRGMICYRPNLFLQPKGPHVAVQIDPSLGYLHPNCSRQRGSLLCLGELPESPFPLPLDLIMENHVYPIVTYQNMTPSHPFDHEAAMYFAFAAEAMSGLQPVPPLY